MTLRIGELFAGVGGLGLGVRAAIGGEVAWVSDICRVPTKDNPATHHTPCRAPCSILAHRFPGIPNIGDITKVDWSAVEPVDVLTGGFPCQDVSHAGKRAGIRPGTRSGLWSHFAYAIDQLRPSLVVIENVRGLLSARAHSDVEPCPWCVGDDPDGALRALGAVLGSLAELGYDSRVHGLRAADVGAPHGRWRVFIVATPGNASESAWRGAQQQLLGTPARPAAEPRESVSALALPPTPVADNSRGLPSEGTDYASLPNAVCALLPIPAVNDDQKRIIERAELDLDTGCWLWAGWTNEAATPYGRLSIDGVKVYAHRASYEAFVGSIPEGHEIDHLCQSSLCVCPKHLEAVTPEENRDRVTQRRTHCKRGHEFTEENTYWVRPGARACRACRAWQDKVQKARKKGEEIPLLPTPVTNDMGEGKTVEAWDAWTETMRAKHGNGNGHGASLAIEAQRLLPTPNAGDAKQGYVSAEDHAAKSARKAEQGIHLQDDLPQVATTTTNWGQYAEAIARWEALTRPAPPPTEAGPKGKPRLSAAFSEWMMGLPAGWITDVPDITRNEALKAAGNGVVPQQAEAAVRFLLGVMAEVAA